MPRQKSDRGPGQPPHEPTEKGRNNVMMMKAAGITHEGIAKILDISADTLVKYYDKELTIGLDTCNAQVAGSLFKKAVSNDHPQAASCAIFWLKTRARWRDTSSLLVGGDPDAPPIAGKLIITWGDGST